MLMLVYLLTARVSTDESWSIDRPGDKTFAIISESVTVRPPRQCTLAPHEDICFFGEGLNYDEKNSLG